MNGHEDRFIERLQKVAAPPEPPPPQEEDDQSPASVEAVPAPEEAAPPAEKPSFVPIGPKNVFGHHDAHPLLLDALLLQKYGPLWLDWEPETIWSEIDDDFGQAVSVHNRNKIQAVRLCHLVDTPWTSWEVFVVVAQAFNNNVPNFRTLQRPTVAQILNAVSIMDKIKSEDEVKFSEEVMKFIAACFLDEGVVYLPPPVDEAQHWASRPRYRCSKCGKIDSDDDNDICDNCGVSDEYLVREMERDYRSIKKRYDECVAAGPKRDELGDDTPEDVQTAKLLVADEYVKERRRQLEEQTRILRDVRSHL